MSWEFTSQRPEYTRLSYGKASATPKRQTLPWEIVRYFASCWVGTSEYFRWFQLSWNESISRLEQGRMALLATNFLSCSRTENVNCPNRQQRSRRLRIGWEKPRKRKGRVVAHWVWQAACVKMLGMKDLEVDPGTDVAALALSSVSLLSFVGQFAAQSFTVQALSKLQDFRRIFRIEKSVSL